MYGMLIRKFIPRVEEFSGLNLIQWPICLTRNHGTSPGGQSRGLSEPQGKARREPTQRPRALLIENTPTTHTFKYEIFLSHHLQCIRTHRYTHTHVRYIHMEYRVDEKIIYFQIELVCIVSFSWLIHSRTIGSFIIYILFNCLFIPLRVKSFIFLNC